MPFDTTNTNTLSQNLLDPLLGVSSIAQWEMDPLHDQMNELKERDVLKNMFG